MQQWPQLPFWLFIVGAGVTVVAQTIAYYAKPRSPLWLVGTWVGIGAIISMGLGGFLGNQNLTELVKFFVTSTQGSGSP
jgi:hypothetical protein